MSKHITPGEKFLSILQEQLGLQSIENEDMAMTVREIGADSLDVVEIIMALEEGLGIEISDDEAMTIFGDGRSNTIFHAKNEVDALFVRKTRATS